MSNQTPQQEIAERVAEGAPGLGVAAYGQAIQDHRRMMADYRTRVADSHRWEAKSLGVEAGDAKPGDDDMGDLIVTGDVYGSDAAEIIRSLKGMTQTTQQPVLQPVTQQSQQPTTAATDKRQQLIRAALIAAGLLGAGGLGAAGHWLTSSPTTNTTITQPNDQQRLGIEVVPGGAMQQQ